MIYLRVGKWPGGDSGPFWIDFICLTKHYFFYPFLDPRDDAKTSPKHPQNFLEKLHFRPLELFCNMSGTCPKSVSYLTITYVILSYSIISYHMISYDIMWYHMMSYDIIWYHMISYDIKWYDMMLYDKITYLMFR